uniref:BTB domain-containing protein n=1 Tax=Meloidogyne hapla TaxID=6305 RepID=A0A1I8B9P2_MELHA
MAANDRELITCSKVWNVKNISTIAEPLGNDYYISCCRFSSGDYPTISWEMNVYLNGYEGGIYGSVNVALRQVGLKGNDSVKAKYKFYAIQNNGARMNIGSSTQKFKYWTESSRFNVNMQSLLQANGSITLGCEVEFTLENLNLEYIKKDESAIYSKDLLKNIFENKQFTDCVIQIDDVLINAHRCILAKNSEVFKRMFEQTGMTESQNVRKTRKRSFQEINKGVVNIDDCSPLCFQAMLEYCYTGVISNSTLETLGDELYSVAHKYEIIPLKEKCENYMASIACVKFISANKDSFLASNEWREIKCKFGELSHRLLELVVTGKV